LWIAASCVRAFLVCRGKALLAGRLHCLLKDRTRVKESWVSILRWRDSYGAERRREPVQLCESLPEGACQ